MLKPQAKHLVPLNSVLSLTGDAVCQISEAELNLPQSKSSQALQV